MACGFALLVATLHALVCARRCAAGVGRGSDWLLVLASVLVLPPALFWRLPASANPDLPVFFLALAVAWVISLLEEEKGGAYDGSRHAEYYAARDRLSGPLRLEQSAQPGAPPTGMP